MDLSPCLARGYLRPLTERLDTAGREVQRATADNIHRLVKATGTRRMSPRRVDQHFLDLCEGIHDSEAVLEFVRWRRPAGHGLDYVFARYGEVFRQTNPGSSAVSFSAKALSLQAVAVSTSANRRHLIHCNHAPLVSFQAHALERFVERHLKAGVHLDGLFQAIARGACGAITMLRAHTLGWLPMMPTLAHPVGGGVLLGSFSIVRNSYARTLQQNRHGWHDRDVSASAPALEVMWNTFISERMMQGTQLEALYDLEAAWRRNPPEANPRMNFGCPTASLCDADDLTNEYARIQRLLSELDLDLLSVAFSQAKRDDVPTWDTEDLKDVPERATETTRSLLWPSGMPAAVAFD